MASSRKVNCIVAIDLKSGMGKEGKIPWHVHNDYKYFKKITSTTNDPSKKNAIIMGKMTWLMIPEKFRPLKRRLNVLLSRTTDKASVPEGVVHEHSLTDAMQKLNTEPLASEIEKIFIIGGRGVYDEAIKSDFCHRIYVTRIHDDYDCDVFFPDFDTTVYKEVSDPAVPEGEMQEGETKYQCHLYERQ